jgi:hypothetical protein
MCDDQRRNFHLLSFTCSLTSLTVLEGTWARLAQVRQPHPKCLDGTWVDLLNYIHDLLDDPKNNQFIWLHHDGTAGVGKSAFAFTSLKVAEEMNVEKRLVGEHFFSRASTPNTAQLDISLQHLFTILPPIFQASGRM